MEESVRWQPRTSAKVVGTDLHRQAARAHLPPPTPSPVSVYLGARLLPGLERGGRGHSQQSVGSLSARVRSVMRDRERQVHHPYRKSQREPGRQQSEGLRQPHRPFLSRGRLTAARGPLTRGTKPATWSHHDRTRYLHPRVHGVRTPAALGRWSTETVPGSGPRPHVSRSADKGGWLR